MKLKIGQIKVIKEALAMLDGYDKVVTVDGKDKIIKMPYNFSGKVRWNIGKNLGIMTARLEGFDKARTDIITRISEGSNIIKEGDAEKMGEYLGEMKQIVESEEEVDGILQLSQADLKLDSENDVNPIPPSAISGLESIMK